MNRISRRRFLAAGVTATMIPSFARPGRAHPGATQLRATRRVIEVNGKAANVFGLVRPDGRHGIVAEAGKRFHVRLVNELDEHTLVHWHGLTPPSEQDGVPGLSQAPLPAGGDYEYDFVLARPGTNWMHSHVGLQEQQLLAAPLIVRDPADAARDEQEVVILLHDFTFRDPAAIYAELTGGMGDMAGMDHSAMGHDAAPMAGMQPHLNDIEFDAYLANDRTLNDPEVVQVEAGGRVRLRIINAAASTNFWLDLGALAGELIAVDGHHGQTDAADRDALANAGAVDQRPGANPQARAVGETLDGLHFSHFLDDPGKHQAATYPSIAKSAPRLLTRTS